MRISSIPGAFALLGLWLICTAGLSPAWAQGLSAPEQLWSMRVVHVVLSDNGDGDAQADSNETVTVRLRVING